MPRPNQTLSARFLPSRPLDCESTAVQGHADPGSSGPAASGKPTTRGSMMAVPVGVDPRGFTCADPQGFVLLSSGSC